MGLFDRFKKQPVPVVEEIAPVKKPRKPRIKKEEAPIAKPKRKSKAKVAKVENPAKVAATALGEPWVSVVGIELDPENIGNGAFELDWNDKFVADLVRSGYQLKANEEDNVIVDRWFQEICKNISAENFEQWEANQPFESRPRVMDRKDIGGGKTEVS